MNQTIPTPAPATGANLITPLLRRGKDGWKAENRVDFDGPLKTTATIAR